MNNIINTFVTIIVTAINNAVVSANSIKGANMKGILAIMAVVVAVTIPVQTGSSNGLVDHTSDALMMVLEELNVPTEVGMTLYNQAVANNYDFAMLLAQSFVESSFNEHAVSYANAYGLMQIMWSANDHMNAKFGTELDRFDTDDNVTLGITFMTWLQDHYGYSVHEALRHYNGGRNWRSISTTDEYAVKIINLYAKMNNVVNKHMAMATAKNEYSIAMSAEQYEWSVVANDVNAVFGWLLVVLFIMLFIVSVYSSVVVENNVTVTVTELDLTTYEHTPYYGNVVLDMIIGGSKYMTLNIHRSIDFLDIEIGKVTHTLDVSVLDMRIGG